MKKGILIVSLLCFSLAALAQAEDVKLQMQESDSVQIKGVHPYKLAENEKGIDPEIAHWSIIPHIGFSAFDGDFTSEMKHNVAIPSVGLAVEYNFTPIWSIGVEYMYDMYTVTGRQGVPQANADTLLNGHMHKAGAYLSMDLINLMFPRAKKKIVSIIPQIGGGMAWYKRNKYYMDDRYYDVEKGQLFNDTHARGNTANYINADGVVGPEHDSTYNMLAYLQAGVNVEFNINRTLALGIRANYSYFTRDYMDGRGYHKHSVSSYASKNNDGVFDVTLNLRFKLEAVSKSHPRNMPSFDSFDKMLAAAEPKVIPHDTIIIRHDSVIVREVVKEAKPRRVFNVYFANDDATLDERAHSTIYEASTVLEEEPEMYAVLIGYCDNTGSKAHNFDLGDRRSNNVADELLNEYGIPESHIFNAGVGKIAARKADKSFGPNRRVSIHIVDKETFELMKLQLNDKKEVRDTDDSQPVTFENSHSVKVPRLEAESEVTTIPLSESARKEVVNLYKTRKGERITVEKGMSLSKYARQYYDNTICWVYIYCANTDQIATPNDLKEGMEILIPELTEEELKISQQECIRLYNITFRQNKK